MQAPRTTSARAHRFTALVGVVALATGMLIGAQIDVMQTRSQTGSTTYKEAVPAVTRVTTPLFIIGDTDGVAGQQMIGAMPSAEPLFIIGDTDGVANHQPVSMGATADRANTIEALQQASER